MDTYVVIHLKNKQEKVSILNLLATETEADYKVTTDLKGFLAKQLNVTIVENKEVRDQATDTGDQEDVKSVVLNQSTIDFTFSTGIHENVPIFAGPWLDSMMDGSQETTVKMELEDGEQVGTSPEAFEAILQTLFNNTAPTRKSGRLSKRLSEVVEDVPKNGNKRNTTECQKCTKKVAALYSFKLDHAINHTELMRTECLVDGCGFKGKHRNSIAVHMKNKHPTQPKCWKEVLFTREEKDDLDAMIRECFPESDDISENSCHICYQNITGTGAGLIHQKREHSLNHIDFMMYKCAEDDCHYQSKKESTMRSHGKSHGIVKSQAMKIELTKEQEEELENIAKRCFPDM